MAYNKHENAYEINEQQLAAFLADALARVESDRDPETLNKLKKIYKKNIPFSRRMYVAAYLMKQATANGYRFNRNDRFNKNDRFASRNESRDRRSENKERTEKFARTAEKPAVEAERTEKAPRVQIDPALATTIFIGIGRNRRVYPRDLVGLLVSVAGLDRERIGDIRVLANYSFIQLFTEDCEKAIKALNEYEYRGRKLSVSYSRQKEEGEDASSEKTESAPAAPVAESIPSDVTNETHAVASESAAQDAIEAEQKAFAASMNAAPVEEKPAYDITKEKPFTETTDDGQIKSHFSSGDIN